MKKLSVEKKAKAYDEALEKARQLCEYPTLFPSDLKDIFPELRESENERIRKTLINMFKGYDIQKVGDFTDKEIIAWLEKQAEQKPDDKVEPKFKAGDKIQYSKGCGTILTIEKIENGEYIFGNNKGHITIESGNKWYLVEQNLAWSEEDEKLTNRIEGWLDTLCDYLKDDNSLECIKDVKDIVERLKSIKGKYTWKPSDEQMEVVESVINNRSFQRRHLDSLYNDLKKLRGE